jgi:hypothetical protein
MNSPARTPIISDKQCKLPDGISFLTKIFPESEDTVETFLWAMLQQRDLFPQTGDQVMYAQACVLERFLPRPNAISSLIQSRQFFIRCVTVLLQRYCWLDRLQ